MRFPNFKELKQGAKETVDVVKYLTVDLVQSLRELTTGLERLDFTNNFESFEILVTLPNNTSTEVQFRGALPNKEIPTRFLVMDRITGPGVPRRGPTPWDGDFVYLVNTTTVATTCRVRFFK